MRLASIVLLWAFLLPIDYPIGFLSTSADEVQPGQTWIITASVYSDAPTSIFAELRVPQGFSVTRGVQVVQVDQGKSATIAYRVQANDAAPSLTPYTFGLYLDTRLVATTTARVCCAHWPDAAQRRVWLPLVRR